MLSLRELRRAACAIELRLRGPDGEGHRLERVVQPDATSLALSFYGRDAESREGVKRHLVVSCDPQLGRVCEVAESPRAPGSSGASPRRGGGPPAFASYLRAHLGRARLLEARLRGEDRQLGLVFETKEGRMELLLSLLGNRSNCYVLDAEDRVVAAQRPLEKTRAALAIGGPWQDPPPPPGGAREGEDRFAGAPDAAYLGAIAVRYGERESEQRQAGLGRALAQALRKERKAAARRFERVEAELAEADQASELQRHGELLKGHLGEVRPGASEICVRDYESGEEVTIPLDPTKSPRDNLEATFKRYQKLVRRLTKAGGQVDRAREALEELESLEAELTALLDAGEQEVGEALEEFVARERVAALLARHAPRGAAVVAPAPAKLPGVLRGLATRLVPRRYRSRDGLEIWVGRSDEGNDYLTTRLARGKDLFFHLDGAPGSHVILRTEGRSDPPSESLLDACELAVHFSKAKKATRADVHVVPIKQVKKPKGAKRGLVWVTGGRSIHLRREDKRLERLMASRIDG